jgi:hypothetical protein
MVPSYCFPEERALELLFAFLITHSLVMICIHSHCFYYLTLEATINRPIRLRLSQQNPQPPQLIRTRRLHVCTTSLGAAANKADGVTTVRHHCTNIDCQVHHHHTRSDVNHHPHHLQETCYTNHFFGRAVTPPTGLRMVGTFPSGWGVLSLLPYGL